MTAKEKSKFRTSSKWKKFRVYKKKEQNNERQLCSYNYRTVARAALICASEIRFIN